MSGNYGGRQGNCTAYVKTFTYGIGANLWKKIRYTTTSSTNTVITTVSPFESLYIPGNIYVGGNIIIPSDSCIKNNISSLSCESANKVMKLNPSSFTFKNDNSNKTYVGFIANELELLYPELVEDIPDINYAKIKAVNYLGIIPLLVKKVQLMQEEIDDLKLKINSTS
jgi:hypothetical protein